MRVRECWRPNRNCNILTLTYGRQRCVYLVLRCSTGGPGAHSAGWWLSLLHLISIFSGPQTPSGFRGPPRPDVTFPTTSRLLFFSSTGTRTQLPSVLTELYNSSTPTRSLELNVGSSSSGNNCHAVQRSLSSGASVYECTMGTFYLVPFHQPISAHAISSHNCR